MDESMYLDAEYESIRAVMNSRGHSGDKLPGKVVRFLPEERADRVCALDDRIQKIGSIYLLSPPVRFCWRS